MQSNHANFGYGMYFGGVPERSYAQLDRAPPSANFAYNYMYNTAAPVANYGLPTSATGIHAPVLVSGSVPMAALGSHQHFDPQRSSVNALAHFSAAPQQAFAFNQNLQLAGNTHASVTNALFNGMQLQNPDLNQNLNMNPSLNLNHASVAATSKSVAPKSKKRRSNENVDVLSHGLHKRVQLTDALLNPNTVCSVASASMSLPRPCSSNATPLSSENGASPPKRTALTPSVAPPSLSDTGTATFKAEWLNDVLTAKRIALLKSVHIQALLRTSQQRVLLRKRASLFGEVAQ